MSEPTTEAGKALRPWLAGHFFPGRMPGEAWDEATERILAIEAEVEGPWRELADEARLVSQWCDSIGSGPIEVLNEDLRSLGVHARALLASETAE